MKLPMSFRGSAFPILNCVLRGAAAIGFSAIALSAFAASARADLINNGGFELTTDGPGEFDNLTIATDWTSSGYNFIFASGTGDTTGSNGADGNVALWGLNNGGIDTLPASSPDGGNYVAADGAFEVGAIEQTIDGLTAGDIYTVGFWWAGAQQSGFNGATTEQWQVSLGSETQSTAVVDDVSHGFTGWQYQTFNYTATDASEVLSFLAVGTPTGEPPFVLLDGASLEQVPEPGTLTLMVGGFGLLAGLGFVGFKRRFKS
jgi:hypothetical protein